MRHRLRPITQVASLAVALALLAAATPAFAAFPYKRYVAIPAVDDAGSVGRPLVADVG